MSQLLGKFIHAQEKIIAIAQKNQEDHDIHTCSSNTL